MLNVDGRPPPARVLAEKTLPSNLHPLPLSSRRLHPTRHSPFMLPRRILLLTLLSSIANADVLEFDLKAGNVRSVNIPSAVDDSNFTEPRGYANHGTRTRSFIRRIELTNTSAKPLTGRL